MIMYRQKSLDESSADLYPFQTQAYCSCDWESNWYVVTNNVEAECDDHLHEVWLLSRGESA